MKNKINYYRTTQSTALNRVYFFLKEYIKDNGSISFTHRKSTIVIRNEWHFGSFKSVSTCHAFYISVYNDAFSRSFELSAYVGSPLKSDLAYLWKAKDHIIHETLNALI